MPDRTWRLAPTLAILVSLLALAWYADGAQAYSSKLLRYPYLTDVVGSSATINWATDRSSTTSVLKWGEADSGSCISKAKLAAKTSITVNSVGEYQWKARLFNLKPDTQYCYRVYLGSGPEEDLLGEDPSPRFFSQLPAGSSRPFSFAVFGNWGEVDDEGANPDQANLMRQIATSGVRFALTNGDNAYNSGTQGNYGDLVQTGPGTSGVFGPEFWTVAGSSIPLFPALGNHGISTANTHFVNWPQTGAVSASEGRYENDLYCCLNDTFSRHYGSAWYAFDAGNARFYVLEAAWADTNPGTASAHQNDHDYHWTPESAEYQWLQNDLASHPSQLKFAFFQYPIYSDQKQKPSDPFLQGPDSLEGLLSSHGVDIAFSGDAHLYQRNYKPHRDSLVTYVTGGGGAKLAPIGGAGCSPSDAYGIGWSYSANEGLGKGSACGNAPRPASRDQVFHFLRVSVDGTRVTVTPIDSLGRSFDEVAYDFGAHADLSLTKSDLPDPVPAWQTLTYALTVQNNGPDRATGAMLNDVLPENVSFESVTPSQGRCSHETGTVNCVLGELESGAAATVEIEVIPQSEGAVIATASVHANENDVNNENDTATEETTVSPPTDEVLAFTPSADSSVNSDAPDTNFGSGTSLVVDASPAKDSLLSFDVSGVGAKTVVSAKLRLHCVGGGVTSGGRVHRTADSGWLEQLVTWNTAPVADDALLGSLGPVSPGNWYDVDVTPLVTGDGAHSLRMSSPSPDGADYYSREGPAGYAPQLLVTVR